MNSTPVTPSILREIENAIQSIHFGTVEITIHGSRVVQIEKSEKIRFGERNTEIKQADLNSGGFQSNKLSANRKTEGEQRLGETK